MKFITERVDALAAMARVQECGVPMAVIGTASYWNTEGILAGATSFARKHGIAEMPITVCFDVNYKNMPGCQRATISGDSRIGFLSLVNHIKTLCEHGYDSYTNLAVSLHLDHADPVLDKWALTEGLPYLASVHIDAQEYSYEENVAVVSEYVKWHGGQVLVEGSMDTLQVLGKDLGKGEKRGKAADYAEKVFQYVTQTKVDYVVADLGTEQQSEQVGGCSYLGDRAKEITRRLGKSALTLHGTSCLNRTQLTTLGNDGVVRVNIWTRLVREAGKFAAHRLAERTSEIEEGRFDACDPQTYLDDAARNLAEQVENFLDALGYSRLKRVFL